MSLFWIQPYNNPSAFNMPKARRVASAVSVMSSSVCAAETMAPPSPSRYRGPLPLPQMGEGKLVLPLPLAGEGWGEGLLPYFSSTA